jgi:hypothetical protein
VPRKPNYGFEKRQRELDKAAKKAEKAERRRERVANGEEDAPDAPAAEEQGEGPAPTAG